MRKVIGIATALSAVVALNVSVNAAHADEEVSRPTSSVGTATRDSSLAMAARRAVKLGVPVRLIVDAQHRSALAAVGVEFDDRVATLPQFRASATGDVLSRVMRAGLAHAVSVDRRVPKPRPVATGMLARSASGDTDAAGIVGAASLRADGITGKGTSVAVIDTGIDQSHPYFRRGSGTAIVAQGCFVFYMEEYPPQLPCAGNESVAIGPGAADVGSNPNYSHGTHVAGIVAGNPTGIPAALDTWGIAPDAGLVIARVFGDGGAGAWSSDIIAALDWVASQAATHNIVAVNLSLGSFPGGRIDCSSEADMNYGPAVARLTQAGVAVIAATGNDGVPTIESMPACATGIVSVGATEADNTIAPYSNIAPATDLLAPGSRVFSSTNGGTFEAYDGTSMATPVVSGAYALAHQARPALGNDSWLALLETHSIPVNDTVVKGLPLIQIDVAARIGSGIQLPGAPVKVAVKEQGISAVTVSWEAPRTGPAPTDYVVTVGSRSAITTSTSATFDGIVTSSAPVTVLPRLNGVPGLAGVGPQAFPVDPSLGAVVGGSSVGWSPPTMDFCQPNGPGMALYYSGPAGSPARTLRVTNGDTVQVITEVMLKDSTFSDRSIIINDRRLWTDPDTVAQVLGRGGAVGPRWSLGTFISSMEQYDPPPPQPTQLRAAGKRGALSLSWSANGARSWKVFLNGRAVVTVTRPKATIKAAAGTHTVGVCALSDSSRAVRGSVMTTAQGQSLK